ncbi:glycosyltransferase family 4 protein [Agarivorans sp. MS3-6]|uniref:glycosyltransferase family 4 protein n=1 Tax=Agarivorans sp. TSD2052 TaxID=2937286 RepID=UPI00200CBD8E|nr:glycosyltransferase family 4 protein [Agarivorans sp. TSD2052]UPW20097.1 glycosyltransferase family 4 protein [Agarivorans sp. TSD2052]
MSSSVLVIASFADSILTFRGDLLLAMQANGHQVHVAAPDFSQAQLEQLSSMGIVGHAYQLQRTGLNPFKDLSSVVSLFKLIKTLQPNTVLSYTIKPVIYGSLAARLAGVRQIYSMITGLGYVFSHAISFKQKLLHALVCTMYKLSLALNRAVFFQNPDDRELFTQQHIVPLAKTQLINGSGINLGLFAAKPLPERLPTLRFLLIARLLKDKGIYEYVAAAKILREKGYQAEFHLAGWLDDNPSCVDEADLKQWIEQGLVIFHGRVDDVKPLLENCHVYVLPSYREGTPRTVLEAMATARPIVTTDAPGCRETVIDKQNGFLVAPQNGPALADALICYLQQPELLEQHGQASRQYAEQRYDVKRVNQQILDVINGVS